ncbi:MAG: hypothetical protein H0V74_01125 [Chloroflexi bacterium]|nr:hypothetical protein [Chloroflexota bacterium]
MTLEEAAATAGPLRLPADPRLGPPDAVYVDPARGNQVALVWAAGPELPATLEPGVGLILMTFDGTLDEGIFQKIVGPASVLERLRVSDRPGWWIAGDQHTFLYRSKDGEVVNDERRWVGDALLWSDGTKTYRIESALGRDSTVAIAESLP